MRYPALVLCFLLLALPARADRLNVVTTTEDIAALVRIIGTDHVEVEALCRGYQDPHYLEAKPSHMARLRQADLLAYTGLELEVGWLPLLVSGSRNPTLRAGEPGNLSLADGIHILEVPTGEITRGEGDIHPDGNPHYSLDPRNQIIMAGTISDRLSALDPAHAADFESARVAFVADFGARIDSWAQRLAPLRGAQIVCYHKQWEYLLDWLGIGVLGYVENKPGIPPSPRHLGELQAQMSEAGTRLVLISNFFEPSQAKKVAESSGAALVILPTCVGGEDGLEDPFRFFDYVAERLTSSWAGGTHE